MLSAIVERHIGLHQATGYLFRKQSCLLRGFAKYAASKGEIVVRSTTAVEWAGLGPTVATRHGRLEVVRRFARLVRAEDSRHEIPPTGVFGGRPRRRTPYIFSCKEIRALLDAAASLGPHHSLRPRAYMTLFGLIAATGLRISEALALRLGDITGGGLLVRETKFRKTRLVPLHATTRSALDSYLRARAKHAALDDAVFLSEWRRAMRYPTVIATFLSLVRRIGIHSGPGNPGPRIHDLRHTFAVRSLEQCKGDRDAVARHTLALSTYLGHAHVADTYWYFQATPKLLADIAKRGELLAQRGPQ